MGDTGDSLEQGSPRARGRNGGGMGGSTGGGAAEGGGGMGDDEEEGQPAGTGATSGTEMTMASPSPRPQ
jgi:hypothetical protein